MAVVTVKKRVNRLENLMAQLITTVDRVDQQLDRTDRQMEQTQHRLDQLSATVDRVDRQMEQTQQKLEQFSAEMLDFKEEMQASRERSEQEMREFREELNRRDAKTRKQLEEFRYQMGTLAEDLVAPSIPYILHQIVGCSKDGIEFLAVRVKKRHPVITKYNQEYDVVAVCGDYLFINETKSKLGADHVKEFIEDMLPQVSEFFPEYREKKVIGIIASLYMDASVVRYGERQGLVVLGVGEDLMEVLNEPGFVPKCF